MGNRAVIILENMPEVGIYVHWNGGRSSVEAFLDAARRYNVRTPKGDPSYAFARLTQIIANYFGGTLSIGIIVNPDPKASCYDNGVYIIDGDWNVKNRGEEYWEPDAQMLTDLDRTNKAHFESDYGMNAVVTTIPAKK